MTNLHTSLSKGFFGSPKIIEGAHGLRGFQQTKKKSILIELFEKSSKHDNRSLCLPMMVGGQCIGATFCLEREAHVCQWWLGGRWIGATICLERGTSLVGGVWLLIAHDWMLEKLAWAKCFEPKNNMATFASIGQQSKRIGPRSLINGKRNMCFMIVSTNASPFGKAFFSCFGHELYFVASFVRSSKPWFSHGLHNL